MLVYFRRRHKMRGSRAALQGRPLKVNSLKRTVIGDHDYVKHKLPSRKSKTAPISSRHSLSNSVEFNVAASKKH